MASSQHGDIKKGLGERLSANRLRSEMQTVRKNKRETMVKRFRSNETTSPSSSSLSIIEIKQKLMHPGTVAIGLKALRDYLDSNQGSINFAIESELLPLISASLEYGDNQIKMDALWCLGNFATGDHEQTYEIAKIVPKLQEMILSGEYPIRGQVCWVLGNLAGDCDECRYVVYPTITALVNLLLFQDVVISNDLIRCQTVCAWAISNIMRGATPSSVIISTGRVWDIFNLLESSHLELRDEVAWIVAFLTAKEDAPLQEFVSRGLFERIAHCLEVADVTSNSTVPLIVTLSNLLDVVDILNHSSILQVYIGVISKYLNSSGHIFVLKEIFCLVAKLFHVYPGSVPLINQHQQIMENIFASFLSGVFDLRKDSLLILEQIYRECSVSSIFITIETMEELTRCLKEPDVVVQVDALEIIRYLTLSSQEYLTTFNSIGLMDVLDEIQYGEGDQEFINSTRQLADDLYIKIENMEGFNNETTGYEDSYLSNYNFDHSVIESNVTYLSHQENIPRVGVGRGKHLTTPAWMTEN